MKNFLIKLGNIDRKHIYVVIAFSVLIPFVYPDVLRIDDKNIILHSNSF